MTQIITFFCTRSKWHTFLQFIAENKAWRWGSAVFICSLYFLALATIAWIASSTDLSNASFPPLMGKDLNSFILPILRWKTVVKKTHEHLFTYVLYFYLFQFVWGCREQSSHTSSESEWHCPADDIKTFWNVLIFEKPFQYFFQTLE